MKKMFNQNRVRILWETVLSLQVVDGLKPSDTLEEIAKMHIDGRIDLEDAVFEAYEFNNADIAAVRMFWILSQDDFVLDKKAFIEMHRKIFSGIAENAGSLRQINIKKQEWALEGGALTYPEPSQVSRLLTLAFASAKRFHAENADDTKRIKHIAKFISRLWQVHPFEQFNTRTVAVFFIKYLEQCGYELSNLELAKHPVYFRNALVRSEYSDKTRGIKKTTRYIEKLLKNMVQNSGAKLRHEALHIKGSSTGVTLKVATGVKIKTKTTKIDKPSLLRKALQQEENMLNDNDGAETGVRIKLQQEVQSEESASATWDWEDLLNGSQKFTQTVKKTEETAVEIKAQEQEKVDEEIIDEFDDEVDNEVDDEIIEEEIDFSEDEPEAGDYLLKTLEASAEEEVADDIEDVDEAEYNHGVDNHDDDDVFGNSGVSSVSLEEKTSEKPKRKYTRKTATQKTEKTATTKTVKAVKNAKPAKPTKTEKTKIVSKVVSRRVPKEETATDFVIKSVKRTSVKTDAKPAKAVGRPSVKKAAPVLPKKTKIEVQTEKPKYIPKSQRVARVCKKFGIVCDKEIEAIMEYLLDNRRITTHEAQAITKTKIDHARRILLGFAARNLVSKSGSRRNRVYVLNSLRG